MAPHKYSRATNILPYQEDGVGIDGSLHRLHVARLCLGVHVAPHHLNPKVVACFSKGRVRRDREHALWFFNPQLLPSVLSCHLDRPVTSSYRNCA